MRLHYLILSILLVLSISLSSADTVSFNSGGDGNLIINSDPYIEGVFSQPALCGNSVVEVYEGCDDGNTNNGDGCSSACAVEPSTTTTTTAVSAGGTGSGGGGGTAGTSINSQDLIVIPPEISATVIQGVEETRDLTLRNAGESTLVFLLSVSGDVKDVLSLSEERFVLSSNGLKTIILTINYNEKELLTGRILITYSDFVRAVPIVISTKTENFLFDTSVFLSDEFRKIQPGSNIIAQFNLKEINTDEKVDVVARYVIKDFEGNKYYDDSETYFVQVEKEYTKEFPTQNLPEGKYVLGFEVSYPGAFAVSSATFDVESPETTKSDYGIIFFGVIGGIIIIIVLALVWLMKKRRKGKKKKGGFQQENRQ